MISVAVLVPSAMARARLEALVASRPGLRLAPRSRSPAVGGDHHTTESEADVLLIDPGGRSADSLLRGLVRARSLPPVVLLADPLAPAAPVRLLRVGVRAILPRDASIGEIAVAIEAVAAGLVVLHPSAAPIALTASKSARRGTDATRADPLTPREVEILAMLADGLGNRAIGQRLGISTHTVKFHVAAILDKLNARSRTEAVTIGLRLGLLMV